MTRPPTSDITRPSLPSRHSFGPHFAPHFSATPDTPATPSATHPTMRPKDLGHRDLKSCGTCVHQSKRDHSFAALQTVPLVCHTQEGPMAAGRTLNGHTQGFSVLQSQQCKSVAPSPCMGSSAFQQGSVAEHGCCCQQSATRGSVAEHG